MWKALQTHWPEYLMEAWGLGMFMVSAGLFATLFYAPQSPVSQGLSNDFLKGALMGLAMGVTAIAIIYSGWGKRSGAHINPAVTLTFFRLKKIAGWDALFYALAQFIGGLLGVVLVAILLRGLFTEPPVNYVVTVPGQWGIAIAFVAEFLLSFGLMTMVLATSNTNRLSNYTGMFAGMMVALYIAFEAPISGMSINPARTFASAFPSQVWTAFWIYYFAPPLAMLSAAELYKRVSGLRSRSICCKLHPNGETTCISIDCCGQCEDLVRAWNTIEDPSQHSHHSSKPVR
ncbi:MAG: aquaporin [Cyanobacteria bacterium P01_A01_bin.37]